jgi:hypothetical protein
MKRSYIFSCLSLGAAFAATSIMSQASDQIKPILPILVPKLYRYSMKDICYNFFLPLIAIFFFYRRLRSEPSYFGVDEKYLESSHGH